jgi:hypothetical protein
MVDYLVLSGYATLKFLENTTVPAPKVFSYGISGSGTHHEVGVSFILVGELPGKPWTGQGTCGRKKAIGENKEKIRNGSCGNFSRIGNASFPFGRIPPLQRFLNLNVPPGERSLT